MGRKQQEDITRQPVRNVLGGSRINGSADQPQPKAPLSTRGALSALNQDTLKSSGRDELTSRDRGQRRCVV